MEENRPSTKSSCNDDSHDRQLNINKYKQAQQSNEKKKYLQFSTPQRLKGLNCDKHLKSQRPVRVQAINKYTGCNCRRSMCLKMYCTCFAVGKLCDQTCLCNTCKNNHDNMERSQAIYSIISKDPYAFSRGKQIDFTLETCNCRKSNCVKKYCDCFRLGKRCNNKCNCINCQNKNLEQNKEDQIKQYYQKMKKIKFSNNQIKK